MYRLGILTLTEEIHSYSSYIEKLEKDNSIKKILWKPHPRMQSREIDSFKDFKKVSIINDDIPIELFFATQNCSAACSASIASSALLSGWLYFDIKPSILDAKLSKLSKFPHISKIRQIVSNIGL